MKRVLACLAVLAGPAAAQQQQQPQPPQRTVQLTGMVLVNGFWNSSAVANSDLPLAAAPDSVGIKGGGATIRQTRIGVLVNDPDVLGGTFTGEIDADFYGGQQPSSGGRTFPLLRLRRVTGEVDWSHVQLMVGQEVPLVSPRNPRSLAAVGFPEFSGSGNLWLWIPQIRVTVETGYSVRLALQAAVLAPTAGTPQPAFNTSLDSAERTGRPYLEARLRVGWGPADNPSEFAIGAHQGWLKNLDTLSGDSIQVSQALTADARVVFGPFELLGEAFTGKALAGLGGGGVGQNFGVDGGVVHTKGGWAQINARPVKEWMFGAGCGIDDPKDADVYTAGDSTYLTKGGRLKNLACEGHLEWRPPGPVVLGFEFRQIRTTYLTGEDRVNHLNLAIGYRF
ncbi:MAG TPA: hypothetical protein VNX15_09500 [Gemmatimonadales bacterium]|nr:hypothetical protein [Gemmatimonadales bacterium]